MISRDLKSNDDIDCTVGCQAIESCLSSRRQDRQITEVMAGPDIVIDILEWDLMHDR